MMPTMSSMTLLRTMEEATRMSSNTNIAPMKAAKRMAKNPVRVKLPTPTLPPISSMTKATPKPAPLLMPKMLGPANGLRKAV